MKWTRFPRVFGLVVCLYFLSLTVYFGYQTSQRFLFLENARPVSGVVLSLEARPVGGARARADTPGVPTAPRVRYVVDGKAYEFTSDRARINQRLRVGESVTVLYDPRQPERAQLLGEGRFSIPLITAGFGTLVIGVAVLLFLTRNVGRPVRPALRRAQRPEGQARGTEGQAQRPEEQAQGTAGKAQRTEGQAQGTERQAQRTNS